MRLRRESASPRSWPGSGDPRRHDLLASDPVLSRHEAEVARLVALGFGNGDIARELVLSENHVQHILTKLGFRNRSQIAAWVSSEQLE